MLRLTHLLGWRTRNQYRTQDMGGGTFDVSLLTIEDGIFEVKVPPLRVL